MKCFNKMNNIEENKIHGIQSTQYFISLKGLFFIDLKAVTEIASDLNELKSRLLSILNTTSYVTISINYINCFNTL